MECVLQEVLAERSTGDGSSDRQREMQIEFFALGANHRTAGIDQREQIALSPAQQQALTARLLCGFALREVAVLCTCNRTEIYGVADACQSKERLLATLESVTESAKLDAASFYYYRGVDALEHLFRVASSLDSQIIGETHILGQVKDCYQESCRMGAAAKWLNIFFQKSFQVAKRVRNETAITALPVSTGSCAVAVARKIFGDLAGRRVLMVGMGQTGQAVARHFCKHGVSLTLSNRTDQTAQALARELGAATISFDQWLSLLPGSDIAVFATHARAPLLTLEQAAGVARARKNQPLLLLDLSIPRNLHPSMGDLLKCASVSRKSASTRQLNTILARRADAKGSSG